MDDETWKHYATTIKKLQHKNKKHQEWAKTSEILKTSYEKRNAITEIEIPYSFDSIDNLNFQKDTSQNFHLDHKTRLKIKKGQYKIDITVDLHHKNQNEAYNFLKYQIIKAINENLRLLLVISGKGNQKQPSILRESLPKWLASPEIAPYIVYYTNAIPKHGGLGAFYVLIKRNRKV